MQDYWACIHCAAVRGDVEMKWCEIFHHTAEERKDHILKCANDKCHAACTELLNDVGQYIKKNRSVRRIEKCIVVQGLSAW